METKSHDWKVIKDELSILNPDDLNYSDLSEDMLQLSNSIFKIDAGWYEGISSFIVYLLRNDDWENPIVKITSYNLENCRRAIQLCIEYSKELP